MSNEINIGDTGRDLSGNIAGRDIHITNDPALLKEIAEQRALIDNQAKQLAQLGLLQEQIDGALAPLRDKLAALEAQLKSDPPDDNQGLQQMYLHRVFQEAQKMPSLTHIDSSLTDKQIQLNQVYTALLTRSTEEQSPGHQPEREKPKPLSALNQLNRHQHLVLIGDPGGGKSTFVDFVTLCMAGHLLDDPTVNLDLLRTPLPKEGRNDEPAPQPWDHSALIPIKVVLRKFTAEGLPPVGQTATAHHLWVYLKQKHTETTCAAYIEELEKQCRHQGGILLFDGLDEVTDPTHRCPQLKQVIEDVATCYPNCRLVVTSRPYGYKAAWQLDHRFQQTSLAPFTEAQIGHFIDRWYGYLGYDDRAESLKRAIFGNSRLKTLAERPLLLTLMANLNLSRGQLPEKRAELYEETTKLLLERWERARFVGQAGPIVSTSLSHLLQTEQRRIRAVLEELAYDAHTHQPLEVEGTANVDTAKLLSRLMKLAPDDLNPQRVLDFLDHRAAILEGVGDNLYRFPHRTFQEYLAACYLYQQDDFEEKMTDLFRTEPARWQEVALLAGAQAADRAKHVWLFVDALCPTEVPSSPSETDLRAALLAGQIIQENIDLTALGRLGQPRTQRVKGWLKHILETGPLPVLERFSAGQVLGQLGDDREGVGVRVGVKYV